MGEEESRVGLQSIPTHKIYPGTSRIWEDLYYPINHYLLRNLLGQILTQVEAMNLSGQSEKALKAIFTQMAWRWFDEVTENSITSAPDVDGKPCVAPVLIKHCQHDKSGTCSSCSYPEFVRAVQMPKLEPTATPAD